MKRTRPFQKIGDLQFLYKGHVLFREVKICSFCEKDTSFFRKVRICSFREKDTSFSEKKRFAVSVKRMRPFQKTEDLQFL